MNKLKYKLGPGEIMHLYNASETKKIDESWVKTYCKDRQGANINAYRWHIFSFERYPSVEGNKANERFYY